MIQDPYSRYCPICGACTESEVHHSCPGPNAETFAPTDRTTYDQSRRGEEHGNA